MRMQGLVLMLFLLLASCSGGASTSPTDTAVHAIQKGAVVIDVRKDDEFAAGHLNQALHIPHDQIADRLTEIPAAKNDTIVLYCGSGRRAGIAQEVLQSHGYTNVINGGGYGSLAMAMSSE